jgi:site-specific recombinase XerC
LRAADGLVTADQLWYGFATLMLESGEDLANVSNVLGHSMLATTADFCGHLTPTTSRRAADRMRGILAG